MALTGTLVNAAAQFRPDGTTVLDYTINIEDDTLGVLGSRGYTVDDPAVVANVLAYVSQMLPMIEAQTGIPVSLPVPPPPPPDVE
jgi:acetyl-CoA carboxylase alpha subunit